MTLNIWRQKSPADAGRMVKYQLDNVSEHMSFLEMLDVLNEQLTGKGEIPISFDHDCREGICGSCGFVINGVAHGPRGGTTVCQLHMREFKSGDELFIEPWRPSRSSKILSSTGALSIGSSKPGATSASPPAAHPTATPFPCRKKSQTAPCPPPRVSAVERALRPALTPRPHSSPRPKSPILACSRKVSPSATTAP